MRSIRIAVAGAATAAALWAGTPVVAQTYPGGDQLPEETLADEAVRGDAAVRGRPTQVEGVQASRLAVTGGDVAGLTAIGAGLIGAGAVLVRRSRRTAPVTS